MAWKFNNIEIPWIEDVSFDPGAGLIELNCLSIGDLKITDTISLDGVSKRQKEYTGERVVIGSGEILVEADTKVIIEGSNTEDENNRLWAYDSLYLETCKDKYLIDFRNPAGDGFLYAPPTDITQCFNLGVNQFKITAINIDSEYVGSSDIYLTKMEGTDPRDEIEVWREIEATASDNPIETNTGRILQSAGAISYTLTDGEKSWNAVLQEVNFKEDEYSLHDTEYTLKFITGGVVLKEKYGKCFVPDDSYVNMEYSPYYDDQASLKLYDFTDDELSDKDMYARLGFWHFKHWLDIKRIDVYGGAIDLPAWISVNGVKKYWHYRASEKTEKLTWYLTDTQEVKIVSPNGKNAVTEYFGSKVKTICADILPSEDEYNIPEPQLPDIPDVEGVDTVVDGGTTDPNSPTYLKCANLMIPGFARRVNYKKEEVTVGTYTYEWDGNNKVYLLEAQKSVLSNWVVNVVPSNLHGESVPVLRTVNYADDILEASTEHGTVRADFSKGCSTGAIENLPPLELTPILRPGTNNIIIRVKDLCGKWIRVQPLKICQTNLGAKQNCPEYHYQTPVNTVKERTYTPPLSKWSYITYSYFTDGWNPSSDPRIWQTYEAGIIKIYESYNVKEVQIMGCGCMNPSSVTVNGVTKKWNKYHDQEPKGKEVLTFPISPPTQIIDIKTTKHIGSNKADYENPQTDNRGMEFDWIKVIYDVPE